MARPKMQVSVELLRAAEDLHVMAGQHLMVLPDGKIIGVWSGKLPAEEEVSARAQPQAKPAEREHAPKQSAGNYRPRRRSAALEAAERVILQALQRAEGGRLSAYDLVAETGNRVPQMRRASVIRKLKEEGKITTSGTPGKGVRDYYYHLVRDHSGVGQNNFNYSGTGAHEAMHETS